MNITFALVYQNKKVSPLRVIITHKGKVWRKSVGISVTTADWSKVRHRTGTPSIDKKIIEIRNGLEAMLDNDSTPAEIEYALTRITDGQWNDGPIIESGSPSFWQYFKQWSERPCSSLRQHRSTYKTVLGLMGERWDWDTMDNRFYHQIIRQMEAQGYSVNYQGNIIQRIKTVMNEGRKAGYHNNTCFQEWKRPTEDSFSIALTENEMMMLWNADNLTLGEQKVRDLAWLGYLTASRYSDYSRLSVNNIYGDAIRFFQKKTDGEVLIPCSPKIKTILERNNGRAPKMVDQVFNREIKNVCRKVGITDVIQVPKSTRRKKGWSDNKAVEKWEMVSSHSFRRSGASALYRSGVPARVVRYLTGHSTDKQLFKYIKIDKEEGLELLARSAFFK